MILLGTDRNLFVPGSAVRSRVARFGEEHTERLDSIVFSTRAHGASGTHTLASHVYAHPTCSRSRLLYGLDALRIARTLPRPDVVSAQDPFETGLAALMIARYFKVPLAVEVHTDVFSPAFAASSPLNRLRVGIAHYVLARAKGGYAVSAKIRDGIRRCVPTAPPLAVLPIFVDTKRFAALAHEPHPRFSPSLLWVGRMEPEKDPMRALDACIAARCAGFVNAGITFAGDGRLREALQEKARASGMGDWVVFAGMVRDVAPYYAAADLLLVTSRFEGYGMALVEARAAHVPVLSRDVGIAREAGAVIAEGDFSAALIAYLKDPPRAGTQLPEWYSDEDDYFTRVAEYYRSLI